MNKVRLSSTWSFTRNRPEYMQWRETIH